MVICYCILSFFYHYCSCWPWRMSAHSLCKLRGPALEAESCYPRSRQRRCIVYLGARRQSPQRGWLSLYNPWLSGVPATYVLCLSHWIETPICPCTVILQFLCWSATSRQAIQAFAKKFSCWTTEGQTGSIQSHPLRSFILRSEVHCQYRKLYYEQSALTHPMIQMSSIPALRCFVFLHWSLQKMLTSVQLKCNWSCRYWIVYCT